MTYFSTGQEEKGEPPLKPKMIKLFASGQMGKLVTNITIAIENCHIGQSMMQITD